MKFDRQYDDQHLQPRQRHKPPNMQNMQQQQQQQQTRADINMKAPMQQPQPTPQDMLYKPQDQRVQPPPLPVNKNQQREPQRDNWYRDDWFSRQDNTWQQGAQRSSGYAQYAGDYRNRRRSPSPERGWEVDLGGGGGYYRYN